MAVRASAAMVVVGSSGNGGGRIVGSCDIVGAGWAGERDVEWGGLLCACVFAVR